MYGRRMFESCNTYAYVVMELTDGNIITVGSEHLLEKFLLLCFFFSHANVVPTLSQHVPKGTRCTVSFRNHIGSKA